MTNTNPARRRAFVKFCLGHPAGADDPYLEHPGFALDFGTIMLTGGLARVPHGISPFCCVTNGSRRVRALHARLQNGRRAFP